MCKYSLVVVITMAALVFGLSWSLASEGKDGPGVSGNLEFGYRSVDVNGSKEKYREEINLESGFRLFDLSLKGQTLQNRFLDSFDLQLDNVGGDPFVRYNLTAEKSKLYKVELDYKKMDFFYNLSNDFHAFDTKREVGDFRVIINPDNFPKLTFSYGRTTREGTLLTTRLLNFFPTGIFQVAMPLDEITDSYLASAEFSLGSVDFYLEQSFKKFENNQHFSGPASANLAVGQPTVNVGFFNWNQRENTDQPVSRVKLHSRHLERLDLSVSMLYSQAETKVDINNQQSISNVLSTATGQGDLDKRIFIVDLEGTYALTKQLNLHGLGEWSRLKEDGELNILDSAAGAVPNFAVTGEAVDQVIETEKFGFQLEYFPLHILSLFTGIERQQREIALNRKVQFEETKLTSADTILIFGFNFKPVPSLDISGRFQNGELDNPFTNISPTDTENVKLRFRYKPKANFSLVGTFTSKDTRNGSTNSTAHLKSTGINLWYQLLADLDFSLGYTKQSGRVFSQFTPFSLIPDLTMGTAEYLANNNIYLALINYSPLKKLKLGFDYQFVNSSGSFPLQNTRVGFSIAYLWLKNLETKLKYQIADNDSSLEKFSDYGANLITLSVVWSF